MDEWVSRPPPTPPKSSTSYIIFFLQIFSNESEYKRVNIFFFFFFVWVGFYLLMFWGRENALNICMQEGSWAAWHYMFNKMQKRRVTHWKSKVWYSKLLFGLQIAFQIIFFSYDIAESTFTAPCATAFRELRKRQEVWAYEVRSHLGTEEDIHWLRSRLIYTVNS